MNKKLKQLEKLFDSLTQLLNDELTRERKEDEGPPSPALLNVVRQFLKDNEISAVATEGTPLKELVDNLPFDADEEAEKQRLKRVK